MEFRLLLIQKRAYDSDEHSFIFESLKNVGFREDFIITGWVKTFLNDSVMNNGMSTAYFKLERGTRQGTLYLHICSL